MSDYDFWVQRVRFDLKDPDKLVFAGAFKDDNPEGRILHVYIDRREVPVEYEVKENVDVRRRYLPLHMNVGQEICGCLSFSEADTDSRIRITNEVNGNEIEAFVLSARQIRRMRESVESSLEMERVEAGQVILTGWAASDQEVTFRVFAKGRELPCRVVRGYRKDVNNCCPELGEDYQAGYEVMFEDSGMSHVQLQLASGSRTKKYRISVRNVRLDKKSSNTREFLVKAGRYFRKNGWKKSVRRACITLSGKKDNKDYREFLKKYSITREELDRQREEHFDYEPLISIVVPLYCTKERFLKELIDSVRGQTYSKWELCLADGSGGEKNLRSVVEKLAGGDERIRYCLLDVNLGIAGNTNAGLDMSRGEWITLVDHDDTLSSDALYQCVKAANHHPAADVIYSDEDKVDMAGKEYFKPHFKSDFNPDLLRSMNYICHLFLFHRSILERVGKLDAAYDGAQDHDFILRCTEAAEEIYHIPKVLYHWRSHRSSTAENPSSKAYAFENGRKAVQAHLDRVGIPAKAERADFFGSFRIRYHWEEEPLLSIIIPNKDHRDDLKKCIDSIAEKSTYLNYEFVIVENNSEEEETFRYYKELEKRENVTVLHYEGGFNFSSINNFGVAGAKGEYLLLLNNDTEMIEPDGLKEMLDICMREDVGIVGAQLFYEDNTIQHAGVIIGFGGIAGHAFIGEGRGDYGYFSRIQCVQDLSAVTAACMMTKRSVYEQVGGLSEEFRVAFNDIDYCMKVRELGKLVVYNPYATFYHYESKSR
ncbi:MAG: glycosyltransferase family 2 protein [Clostridiales bacterium]|nr:glycosyltransferase family 2 protein [Clostridiales bacterium]